MEEVNSKTDSLLESLESVEDSDNIFSEFINNFELLGPRQGVCKSFSALSSLTYIL